MGLEQAGWSPRRFDPHEDPKRREHLMLETVPRRKLRDVVLERLKSYIVSERLAPGDRLPTETQLAARFGVSRLSLREATKALELLGIVQAKTGVGLTIGQLDVDRVVDHLGFHPALQRAPADELIGTRVALETGALPYAARRMAADPSLAQALQELIDQSRATHELQQWINLDLAFHRALLDASGLSPLVAFADVLQIFFQRFRDSVKKAEWKAGVESHQRLLDALRDQDVLRADRELRSHIESHKSRLGDPA